MDNHTELKTPKNKLRSLGLRRSSQKIGIAKTPSSDVKVNYQSLLTQSGTEVLTPLSQRLSQTIASPACTKSCLPNRLSLNRRAREKYKKKKLQFAAANQLKTDVEIPSDLQQEVNNKEKLLQQHQKHKEKVKELKSVIAIWTEAFKASLEELSTKTEPRMDPEDMIERLGIPSEMVDYT